MPDTDTTADASTNAALAAAPTHPSNEPPSMLQNVTNSGARPQLDPHPPTAPLPNSPISAIDPDHARDLGLSLKQVQAIDLLLAGLPDADAAAQVGVSRMTLYRWRHLHPNFRAELLRLQRQLWRHNADRLRALIDPAINVLAAELADPATAHRAATALLRLTNSKRLAPRRPSRHDLLIDRGDPPTPAERT